jgi:hypothetical protein
MIFADDIVLAGENLVEKWLEVTPW